MPEVVLGSTGIWIATPSRLAMTRPDYTGKSYGHKKAAEQRFVTKDDLRSKISPESDFQNFRRMG